MIKLKDKKLVILLIIIGLLSLGAAVHFIGRKFDNAGAKGVDYFTADQKMQKHFKFNEDVGGLFINLIAAYLILLITLGLGGPWAYCKLERWKANNTTINGRKIKFIGKGSSLFFKFIVWYFLTIITFGIYSLWVVVKLQKFTLENTVFID